MWDEQFEPLACDHLVLRYDLRGFGGSSFPGGPFSYVADLAALLDHLDIAKGTVVGASFGGQVALEFALQHPARVTSLVLVDSAIQGLEWSEEVERFGAAEDDALEGGRVEEAVELNLKMWVEGPSREESEMDAELRERVRTMQRAAFEKQLLAEAQSPPPGPAEWLDPPAISRLAEIRAPTLVVVGDQDVPDFLHISERLTADIDSATRSVIEGAAHLPSLERPEVFMETLRSFLSGSSTDA
ncbi:MAG: alpha/beta fold hydrolase [Actinobacteria bacterium]|nr:alpha/beta fold hydrolase [Actinomycetota bacterium]